MLTSCPYLAVDPAAWAVIEAAELAAHGSWPDGRAGWMHECRSLVQAVRFVWARQRKA